jgi:hypothetical protein
MKNDRDFDIALADIEAENTRLIQEFLRSHRRRRDNSLAGLPKKPEEAEVAPTEVGPQEGEGYA